MSSSSAQSGGCFGCLLKLLLLLVLALVLLAGGAYYAVMHTALPFKTLAAMIEQGSPGSNIQVNGLSGSLASGIGIQSIKWDSGEIGDIRVTYNGLMDLLTKKELIVHEAHIGMAHLDISGWKNEAAEKSQPDNTESPSSNGTNNGPLNLFQIDKLSFADVVLTNPQTGFSLAIPAFEMTGFKATNGKWEFDQLNAESDRLKISTTPLQSAEFQKRVDVTLLPKLHPEILQPIHFFVDAGGANGIDSCRLTAFDGKLVFEVKPDHSGSLHCAGLNLADYIAAPLPQELTVDISTIPSIEKKNSPLKISDGSFKLGVRTFQITSRTFGEGAEADPTHLDLAVSKSAEDEISLQLLPQEKSTAINIQLTAKPPLSPQDTVAQVFYGKPYAELSPSDQKSVNEKVPIFEGTASQAPTLKGGQ